MINNQTVKAGEPFTSDDVGLLGKLHNWLIKTIAGRKTVILNVHIGIIARNPAIAADVRFYKISGLLVDNYNFTASEDAQLYITQLKN